MCRRCTWRTLLNASLITWNRQCQRQLATFVVPKPISQGDVRRRFSCLYLHMSIHVCLRYVISACIQCSSVGQQESIETGNNWVTTGPNHTNVTTQTTVGSFGANMLLLLRHAKVNICHCCNSMISLQRIFVPPMISLYSGFVPQHHFEPSISTADGIH